MDFSGGRNTPRAEGWAFARRALTAVVIAAGVAVLLLLVWYVAEVFLLVFAGTLLAVFLRGLGDWVSQHTTLSGGWSLALVLLALALLVGLGGLFLASALAGQFDQLAHSLTVSVQQLEQHLRRYEWGRRLLAEAPGPGELLSGRVGLLSRVTGLFSTALDVIANGVIILFIGTYLAVDPGLYQRGLRRLLPVSRRDRGREVLDALGSTLRRWLVGQFFNMTAVGVTTAVGLLLLAMPVVLVLALIALLFDFVPYFGPIIAAVPAVLVALTIGPWQALYVGLLYLGVQSVESYLLAPLVQQRSVDLPPALTISAQVFLGVLFGVLGIVLATPLTAALLVLVKMLYVEDTLGDPDAFKGEPG